LPDDRLGGGAAVDIAADDLGDVFLLPSHDASNGALGQASDVEPCRSRAAQVVEVQAGICHASDDLRLVEGRVEKKLMHAGHTMQPGIVLRARMGRDLDTAHGLRTRSCFNPRARTGRARRSMMLKLDRRGVPSPAET